MLPSALAQPRQRVCKFGCAPHCVLCRKDSVTVGTIDQYICVGIAMPFMVHTACAEDPNLGRAANGKILWLNLCDYNDDNQMWLDDRHGWYDRLRTVDPDNPLLPLLEWIIANWDKA
jgi:hypothetical protein